MKLSEVQRSLNAPKNQRNDFGKYNYRNCEDILQAVKPLLGDAVILLSDDIQVVGDRVYVKATATFKSADESIEVTAFAREPLNRKGMDESQITGSASSYARKYALNGLLLIDDNKDADTMKAPDKEEVVFVTNDELNVLRDGLISLESDESKFCKYLGVAKLEVLPKFKVQQAVSAIEASRKKKEA